MNGFYNRTRPYLREMEVQVVIPLRMNGFYNLAEVSNPSLMACCHTAPNERLLQHPHLGDPGYTGGCHTAPNERLLQRDSRAYGERSLTVVIPLRMNGFYNRLPTA